MNHRRIDQRDGDTDGTESVRVLLVGDEEPFLHRLGELFTATHHRVTEAYDARAALAAVGEGAIDVIVCDLGATRLQSISTALALRALGDEAPPLVMISSMPNLAQHCAALRVEHFLAQPFRFSRLVELTAMLSRESRSARVERSGVFLRAQVADLIESLPEQEALSFG